MAQKRTKGVQEARQELPALLEAAHRGSRTIITKHGKPYAAIVPVGDAAQRSRGLTFTAMRGTGKKIWKRDVAAEISRLRGDWD